MSDGLDAETRDPPAAGIRTSSGPAIALTIAYHPDRTRIGDRAIAGHELAVSRLVPVFAPPREGGPGHPLADDHLSRTPLTGRASAGSVHLAPSPHAVVDGRALDAPRVLGPDALARGVVIELGHRVVLVLHHLRSDARMPGRSHGLVGESDGVVTVREDIDAVAGLDLTVLVRGETGTGKELVAQAIHAASRRAGAPFVALSMAAVAPTLAASELFGHRRGAFSGATDDREGAFRRAHGGTLFLDEIGECPVEVQVMLLRALETGRVQPLGADQEVAVDVRLITATDAALEAAVAQGRFRAALLHRLAGYDLALPPLRARRDDIGRLMAFFLRDEAELDVLPSDQVARMIAYDWPGNVRQLRNVTRQLAVAVGQRREDLDRVLDRLLTQDVRAAPIAMAPPTGSPTPAPVAPAAPAPAPRRKPADVGGAELLATLERNQWRLDRTAVELGISRPSLYRLIDAHPGIRKSKDLSRAELSAALESSGRDIDRMVELLRVSKAGLRLRLKQEGLADED